MPKENMKGINIFNLRGGNCFWVTLASWCWWNLSVTVVPSRDSIHMSGLLSFTSVWNQRTIFSSITVDVDGISGTIIKLHMSCAKMENLTGIATVTKGVCCSSPSFCSIMKTPWLNSSTYSCYILTFRDCFISTQTSPLQPMLNFSFLWRHQFRFCACRCFRRVH